MPDLNTVLDQHVTLVYESVDRVFLNGYVAKLQEPGQLAWFLGPHRAEALPRYELLGKMTRDFVAAIEQYARDRNIPVIDFDKGQRKETIAEPHFAQAAVLGREGVVLVGIAQEKANVFRPPRREPTILPVITTRPGGPSTRSSPYSHPRRAWLPDHLGPNSARLCE